MYYKTVYAGHIYFSYYVVGTPTWHHIPFLCLQTHPRTNPDSGRLTITVAHPRTTSS